MRFKKVAVDTPAAKADDLFRSRLDGQIDLKHPLIKLGERMDWAALDDALAPTLPQAGGGRPALPVRLMAGLIYLKHANNLSDEDTCWRWLENPYWQYFTGEVYFQTRLPCDPSSLTRWRQRLGEAGMEELLAQTIATARVMKAVSARDLDRVIIDSTVQEKAIAFPTDSRLLEVGRRKLVLVSQRQGMSLRQTYEREGASLSRQAGRYAHARQYKRMRGAIKRQRTILGRLIRDIERKLHTVSETGQVTLRLWLERATRLMTQKQKDKNKLYALHAPEVECISKGKARNPYEFGVKVGLAVTAKQGLIVGARSFPGNPYDGDTLAEQIEQAGILSGRQPKEAIVDLGYRGRTVDGTEILHRGKAKRLTRRQWGWIKRRQAIEPIIGHVKDDCGMRRNRLKGAEGDAIHAVACAAGYNLRWLLRWIAAFWAVFYAAWLAQSDAITLEMENLRYEPAWLPV